VRQGIPTHPQGSKSNVPRRFKSAGGVSQSFVSPTFGFSYPNPGIWRRLEGEGVRAVLDATHSAFEEFQLLVMLANTGLRRDPELWCEKLARTD